MVCSTEARDMWRVKGCALAPRVVGKTYSTIEHDDLLNTGTLSGGGGGCGIPLAASV